MKNLLCILLVFAGLSTIAQGTFSINVTVSDEKRVTLPGATVFITNSEYMGAADNEGRFSFNNIRPGTYEVVVKMLGFKPSVQSVIINNKSADIIFVLKEDNNLLNSITIKGRPDSDRGKYLEWFIKDFIGETVNSQQCKLLNPEVLHFHFDRKTRVLTTNADDFLVIENKALGYKIKYLLSEFKIDLEGQSGYYNGYPYFDELKGSDTQQKKWENNRRVAYLSSARNFFRAVINNTAEKAGFILYKITDNPDVINNDTNIDLSEPIIIINNEQADQIMQTGIKSYADMSTTGARAKPIHAAKDRFEFEKGRLVARKVLHIDSEFTNDKNLKSVISTRKVIGKDTTSRLALLVVYTRVDESALFYHTGHPISNFPHLPRKRQVTQIQLLTDKLIIERNGIPEPETGYKYSGYWAWQRIADLTPLDYSVDLLEGNNTYN